MQKTQHLNKHISLTALHILLRPTTVNQLYFSMLEKGLQPNHHHPSYSCKEWDLHNPVDSLKTP